MAVVVAQLAERSLPTPEIRGSNHDICKILSSNCTFKNRKDGYEENEIILEHFFAGKGSDSIKVIHDFTVHDCEPLSSQLYRWVS